MKNYKKFGKQYIGSSDAAFLTVTGMGEDGVKAEVIKFGGDESYHAYIVTGDDVEIGEHYKCVATFSTWIHIIDDDGISFKCHEYGSKINIYRAGDYGCIIQIIG